MHLIVGLGNPGAGYRDTPHNAGFWVCDRLAERHALGDESRKFEGLLRRGRIGGQDVALLKPQTYMNLSGRSVAEALRYMPVEADELLVVYDEMDLVAGRLRLAKAGGDGGHRGMRSLVESLGTRQFARLRVGVGRPPAGWNASSHLLSRIPEEERELFFQTIERAADAVETVLGDGIELAMNRFNGPAPESERKETQS